MPPVMFSVITKYHKGRHSLFLYNSEIFYAFTQDILRSLIISLITAIVIGQSVLSLLNVILLVMLLAFVSNLGMFGIGLIFGAGSLIFKSIGQWATLLQGIILIFANVPIPYTTWIQAILPFGLGIEIARSLYLQRDVEWITVLVYIVINVILLCIGLLIFNIALQHERKYGSFERF